VESLGQRVQARVPVMVAPYSANRTPTRLVPLPGFRYGISFSNGLFVKIVFQKGQNKKITPVCHTIFFSKIVTLEILLSPQ
jgi:hypothetical protein